VNEKTYVNHFQERQSKDKENWRKKIKNRKNKTCSLHYISTVCHHV